MVPPGGSITRISGRLSWAILRKRACSAQRTSGILPSTSSTALKLAWRCRCKVTEMPPTAISQRSASRSGNSCGQLVRTKLIRASRLLASDCASAISLPSNVPSARRSEYGR
ncbi:hypothetical protein A7D17_19060 [Xanthomonas floridensis]|uniref:Uncharacterized protein n=1 Tax=Xanthomonas floridensis TaxID=1843580 RepID=A0A1A9MBW0_9XANT|nr:hypothetical protein A7D17_19060 [Xanthomonas floridensis]